MQSRLATATSVDHVVLRFSTVSFTRPRIMLAHLRRRQSWRPGSLRIFNGAEHHHASEWSRRASWCSIRRVRIAGHCGLRITVVWDRVAFSLVLAWPSRLAAALVIPGNSEVPIVHSKNVGGNGVRGFDMLAGSTGSRTPVHRMVLLSVT